MLGVALGERAFVRLSTRSPKDCILRCPSIDFKQAIDAEVAQVFEPRHAVYAYDRTIADGVAHECP